MKRAKMFDLNRVLLQPMYSILFDKRLVQVHVQQEVRNRTYEIPQFEQWRRDILSTRNGIIEICRNKVEK